MGTAIEQYRLEEKVRVSYYKNRGKFPAVVDDTGLPEIYVRNIVRKIKKSDDWKVSRLVADNIAENILLGREGRIAHLLELLSTLSMVEGKFVSTCCNASIRTLEPNETGDRIIECLKCGKETDTRCFVDEETLDRKMAVIDLLRKEDDLLAKFMEKLGVTDRQSPPTTVIKNQQNFLVVPGSDIDPAKVQEISKLGVIEQEALRLHLEKTLAEAEIVEDGEDQQETV